MRLRKLVIITAATAALITPAAVIAATSPAAHAGSSARHSTAAPAVNLPASQVCDQDGPPVECLNDWGAGAGGFVKTYAAGANANAFAFTSAYGICQAGSDLTTNNCPRVHVPAGQRIIQINYLNIGGRCVGDLNNDPNNANSALTTCGGWGAYFIVYHGNCIGGYDRLVNIHWTSDWFSSRFLQHANPGDQGNGNQYFNNVTDGRCLASG